ncbi:MAG: hypothetical protein MJ098_01180 [Saccharofermentans sp.]|nr:hypothetical protein [Saccharofermentans sp.]
MTHRSGDKEGSVKSHGPIVQYFSSAWSHLVRLMGVNALFVIFNIPAIAICYLLAFLFLPVLIPAFDWYQLVQLGTNGADLEVNSQLLFLLVAFFITVLTSGLLVCVGPFQAGFARVYKDMRNGTSFSLFGSFKTGIKGNIGKSLVSMVLGIIVSSIILLAISFYMNLKTTIGTVVGMVFIILLVSFILVQNFVYVLIVSTDLKLSKIYKNAVIFLFLRFFKSLGLGIVVFLFFIAIPFYLLMSASYLTLGIFVFLYSFVVVSWIQYALAFHAGELIDKFVAN